MQVDLRYGRDGLRVALPDDAEPTVIEKPAMPLCPDPRAAVAAALARGLDDAAFRAAAAGARSACILICDITRPVPNGLFLRPLIEGLTALGVPREGIEVLVATGLHRSNEGDELRELAGDPWVLEQVRVHNHDARNAAAHTDLGRTSRGTAALLDRRLVQADLRIATGLVEPHFMAGYSGGRKVIAPGVAAAETITTLHNHAFMAHPRATNCALEGNPLHEELLEIVRMLGGAWALNTVIDDARQLAFVNFGEVVSSHLEAVDFVDRYTRVEVGHPFATVLTSSAGHPLDQTYYQTVKGLVTATPILAEGGDLIVASACAEGLGSRDFVAAQRDYIARGRDGFLDHIASQPHAAIDEWQTHKQAAVATQGRISLYSGGLDAEARALTGLRCVDSVEEAVADSITRHGDPRVAVIPEGPYVVPVLTAPAA